MLGRVISDQVVIAASNYVGPRLQKFPAGAEGVGGGPEALPGTPTHTEAFANSQKEGLGTTSEGGQHFPGFSSSGTWVRRQLKRKPVNKGE